MSDSPRPIYGPKAFRLNVKDARAQGFRIFRAWRSCGCCHVDMAFRSVSRIKQEFSSTLFADVVHDDMDNTYTAVNTGRGFIEIKRPGPKRRTSILPIIVGQFGSDPAASRSQVP